LSINYQILIGTSNTYYQPKDIDGEDFTTVLYQKIEIENIKSLEKNGSLQYLVIILIRSLESTLPDLSVINNEWRELTGKAFETIEFVTDEKKLIRKKFIGTMDDNDLETVGFKIPVLGFNPNSKNDKREAEKWLKKIVTKKSCQFWI